MNERKEVCLNDNQLREAHGLKRSIIKCLHFLCSSEAVNDCSSTFSLFQWAGESWISKFEDESRTPVKHLIVQGCLKTIPRGRTSLFNSVPIEKNLLDYRKRIWNAGLSRKKNPTSSAVSALWIEEPRHSLSEPHVNHAGKMVNTRHPHTQELSSFRCFPLSQHPSKRWAVDSRASGPDPGSGRSGALAGRTVWVAKD